MKKSGHIDSGTAPPDSSAYPLLSNGGTDASGVVMKIALMVQLDAWGQKSQLGGVNGN